MLLRPLTCSTCAVIGPWDQVTHICVGNLTIIGSDNGLSPRLRQSIIWTNAGILLIEPLRTIFSEMLIAIQTFSFKKMRLKMSSAKWRPFGFGLNMLRWALCVRIMQGSTCYTYRRCNIAYNIMTPWHRNSFCIRHPLWGEPLIIACGSPHKSSVTLEHWSFLCYWQGYCV